MSDHPGFDPYAVLGVAPDADDIAIQLAYKARIRAVHPDVAGTTSLAAAKQLNVARDWLLDPVRRASLVSPAAPSDQDRRRRPTGRPPPGWRPPSRPSSAHRSSGADTAQLDQTLQAFLQRVRSLSRDERARVNHSLGDTLPVFFVDYIDYLEPGLATRSMALGDAVAQAWSEGADETTPVLPSLGRIVPNGFHVANAYAQWMLLGDFFRRELSDIAFLSDHGVGTLASRSVEPWEAAVGQPRYGPFGAQVVTCLRTADRLSADAADRLARSWTETFGSGRSGAREVQGPGVWLPTPHGHPPVLAVSGYVAAVDATRILPPGMLDVELRPAFTFALRLTAHATALGLTGTAAEDYLGPWREAVPPPPMYQRRW